MSLKNLFLFLIIINVCSCSTAINRRGEYVAAYHCGDFAQTESSLTSTISSEMAECDYRQSKDATWLLLDRATTRFARGNIEGAITDYKAAIEAIDYYNQRLFSESVGKVILQDEIGAYCAADYEQILARIYFALALLDQGDYSNAYAILRQAEEEQQRIREHYGQTDYTCDYQLIDNALGKYLFAALLEKRNDKSNASILYQQAEMLIGDYQISKSLIPFDCEKDNRSATILLICHNGNAPYKISTTYNASVASTLALEAFLGTDDKPITACSLTGFPAPALCNRYASNPIATYSCLDGFEKRLLPIYNIGAAAQQQLDQELPVIVARSIARYMLRRGAVACADQQDSSLGTLVDLGMLIANLNTKADTRSWTTLPRIIDIARFDVPPGTHQLTIQTEPTYAVPTTEKMTLSLSPDDLCIINIFNIHPGITTIQVPKRFL